MDQGWNRPKAAKFILESGPFVLCFDNMNLHCLGTAGYHPSETRHTSCYVLPDCGIVLDAGTGMFRLGQHVRTRSLDILLSHAHLDHVVGLTFLLGVAHQRSQAEQSLESIRVWGQSEKLQAIQQHLLDEYLFPAPLPIVWCDIDSTPSFQIRPMQSDGQHGEVVDVSWRPQTHPGESVAYRLETNIEGKTCSLVYATDTTGASDPETLQWMSGVDLLLHECNFRSHQREWAEKTGHCWLPKAAEVCRASRPSRVVLTHVDPTDELRDEDLVGHFAMPTCIAADGMEVRFGI